MIVAPAPCVDQEVAGLPLSVTTRWWPLDSAFILLLVKRGGEWRRSREEGAAALRERADAGWPTAMPGASAAAAASS